MTLILEPDFKVPTFGAPEETTSKNGRESQTDQILEALTDVEFFHDEDENAFAFIEKNGHYETHQVVHLGSFEKFCIFQYYKKLHRAPNRTALTAAIDTCMANAKFAGPEYPVHLRVAKRPGTIWLDLCNLHWDVVEITSSGWCVKSSKDIPVRFRRTNTERQLSIPIGGERLSEFRHLFNTNDAGWTLIQAAMLGMLRPNIDQAILALYGQQGSGKSVVGRIIRSIIDPNSAPLRSEPRETRDLAAAINNNFVIGIDNVSYISSAIADGLCMITTGGGIAGRALYSDADEKVIVGRRPVILTAIEDVVVRADLADRTLIVRLRSIDESQRIPLAQLEHQLEEDLPRLLGALLDAAVVALQNLPTTSQRGLPRLADFGLWVTAAEAVLDLPAGKTFLETYWTERDRASVSIIEGEVIAEPLRELLEREHTWEGFAQDLLEKLNDIADEDQRKNRRWPKSARDVGGRLSRLAPELARNCIKVEWDEVDRHRGRLIRLSFVADSAALGESSAAPAQQVVPYVPDLSGDPF